MGNVTYAYAADIVKTEKTPRGLMVYGKAAGPELDLDGQRCDPKWLARELPEWMKSAGNIREQHLMIAAGVGKELEEKADGWYLKALIVDKGTIEKIEEGVLTGFSVGVKNGKVVKSATAPKGLIVGGKIIEVSTVDRSSNPTTKMAICKSAGGTTLHPVDAEGEIVEELDLVEKVLSGDLHKSLATMDPDDARDQAGDTLIELCDMLSDQVELLKAAIADGDPADVLELFTITEAIGKFVKDDTDNGDVVGAIEKALSGHSDSVVATVLKAEITKAVAEVKEPLEAKIESLQADLTKALAVPRSGGPVLRVQPNAPTLNKSAEADRLSATADRTADPELKLAYQALATKTREVAA